MTYESQLEILGYSKEQIELITVMLAENTSYILERIYQISLKRGNDFVLNGKNIREVLLNNYMIEVDEILGEEVK
jgi:hypothetical protein